MHQVCQLLHLLVEFFIMILKEIKILYNIEILDNIEKLFSKHILRLDKDMFREFKNDPQFLTLTYGRVNHAREAIDHFFVDYRKIRKNILQKQSVSQYGIWAELTATGQLHWHIIVEIKDKIKFKIACNWWAKNRGFLDIRPVTNLCDLTSKYLNKEREETERYLFRGPSAPSFPLKDDLNPSVIDDQMEYYLMGLRQDIKRKQLIEDIKNFHKLGLDKYKKEKDSINFLSDSFCPSSDNA